MPKVLFFISFRHQTFHSKIPICSLFQGSWGKYVMHKMLNTTEMTLCNKGSSNKNIIIQLKWIHFTITLLSLYCVNVQQWSKISQPTNSISAKCFIIQCIIFFFFLIQALAWFVMKFILERTLQTEKYHCNCKRQ